MDTGKNCAKLAIGPRGPQQIFMLHCVYCIHDPELNATLACEFNSFGRIHSKDMIHLVQGKTRPTLCNALTMLLTLTTD